MSASEESVLGRLFFAFLILCRLFLSLPWFWVPSELEDLLFLELRRRLRLLLDDVEDLLRVEEGNILLLLFLLVEDGLMDMLDTLSRLGLPERNRSEEEEESFMLSSLSSPPPPPPKSSESEGSDLEGVDDDRRYIEFA